jgi:hypothetical protein
MGVWWNLKFRSCPDVNPLRFKAQNLLWFITALLFLAFRLSRCAMASHYWTSYRRRNHIINTDSSDEGRLIGRDSPCFL